MVHRADTLPDPFLTAPLGDSDLDDDASADEDATNPQLDIVSTTLPIAAPDAYTLFCDVERTPEWVSVVRWASVLSRNEGGRPSRVAFLAVLEQATVGYTLQYQYRERALGVRFWSEPGQISIVGEARFTELSPRASMMHYRLGLQLPVGALPRWGDPFFDGHAASAVLGDFRDFATRSLAL